MAYAYHIKTINFIVFMNFSKRDGDHFEKIYCYPAADFISPCIFIFGNGNKNDRSSSYPSVYGRSYSFAYRLIH